jgi:hypothetical protein
MKKPSVDTLIWRAIGEFSESDKFLTFEQRSKLSIAINEILKEDQQSTVDFDRLMTLESEVLRLNKALAVTADMLDNHNKRLIAVSEKVEAIDEAVIDQLQNMPDVEGLEDRIEHAETMGAMFDDRIITLEMANLKVKNRLLELEEKIGESEEY